MEARERDAIKGNLFASSHAAIKDWDTFPWHHDRQGVIQTYKLQSSQALAIDVFGTIKVSAERDQILGWMVRECMVPHQGPWRLELEWTDPDGVLHEPRPTQVDAIAFGLNAVLVIESKFTEGGGACSQPNPIRTGAHRGLRQCDGNYAQQTNPVNGIAARCALTGKGVRYWECVPKIFGLNAEQDYNPCPFKGNAYQWMRNVVLADRLGSARGISSAVIAAYADADSFTTAQKVRSGKLGHAAADGANLVAPLSYQSIVEFAKSQSEQPDHWIALARWVEKKINTVAATLR
jgi:hypothetical protein